MDAVATDVLRLRAPTVDDNGGCYGVVPASFKDQSNCMLPVSKHASDDQVTLRFYQNSATIVQSFEIYIYEITTDARMARCHRQKHRR